MCRLSNLSTVPTNIIPLKHPIDIKIKALALVSNEIMLNTVYTWMIPIPSRE